MTIVLPKQTLDFIESMSHDELVCFLQVYQNARSELDVAQLKAIRDELLKKIEKEDSQLWDKE